MIGANATNGWAPRSHIPALLDLPETELIAVCTAHEETARASAEKFGVELAYHDHHEMLANRDIEAVGVVTRVPLHYQLTKDALLAGKHVYTESPLVTTLEQAKELAGLAKRMGVHTMVGFHRRGSPVFLRLKELIDEGYVGQMLSVHFNNQGGGILTSDSERSWRRDKNLGTNTMTIGFGRDIDAVCSAIGDIAEVTGVVATQVPQWYETDTKRLVDVTSPDNVVINGRLRNGAVITAHVGSQPFHGSGYKLEIYGTEGTLVLAQGGGGGRARDLVLMGGRKDEKALQELPIPDHVRFAASKTEGEAYNVAQMWSKFAEAIREDKRIEPDFETALKSHTLQDAIERASETGQRQRL